MTRVSLTEDYDDRSVISKLNEMDKRVKENASVVTSAEASARQSAQSAQETADRFAGSVGAVVQNANAQINASKAQVDGAKAEVDEAVATANTASASAQASAQTVAGYEDRLAAVESDLNAVTLRVTTAEGQIVTIQGRVTSLETADGQNVKLSGEHAIGNYAVLLTGNQGPIAGVKKFVEINAPIACFSKTILNDNTWQRCFRVTAVANGSINFFVTVDRANAYGGSQFMIGRFSIGSSGALYSLVHSNLASEIHIGVNRTGAEIEISVKIDNSTGRPYHVFIDKVINQNGIVPTDLRQDTGSVSGDPAYILNGE